MQSLHKRRRRPSAVSFPISSFQPNHHNGVHHEAISIPASQTVKDNSKPRSEALSGSHSANEPTEDDEETAITLARWVTMPEMGVQVSGPSCCASAL